MWTSSRPAARHLKLRKVRRALRGVGGALRVVKRQSVPALLILSVACGSQTGPSIATPPINFGAVAVLAVTTFEGTLTDIQPNRYIYRMRLVVAETSRKSNATISGITIRIPGGGSTFIAAPECFTSPPVVLKGEGWDADAVNPACLTMETDQEATTASVSVAFLDDAGTLGVVAAVGQMHR